MQSELMEDGISVFVGALCGELNKLRPNHVFSDCDLHPNESEKIAKALVWIMENGGDTVPAIQKALKSAYMECFHKKGKHRVAASNHKEAITESVEQLLGWLVLAAVDETQLGQLLPQADFSKGVYFEIPVETQGGVELIVSRCSERSADIDSAGSEVKATYQTCITGQDMVWKDSATLDTLKLIIWNKVFPEEEQELPLSATQVKQLDAEISTRRRDDWESEHHYLAIRGEQLGTDVRYVSVCEGLQKELPNLTLVNFGIPGQGSVFYMLEHHLMQVINNFIASVNKV